MYPLILNVIEMYELPGLVLAVKMKKYIRVALVLNVVTVPLHSLTAPMEKWGRNVADIELYALWARSRLIIRNARGDQSRWEKPVLLPPFREFCDTEGI